MNLRSNCFNATLGGLKADNIVRGKVYIGVKSGISRS